MNGVSRGLMMTAIGCLAALAVAQPKVDAFDAYAANIQILQARPVQDELKVSASQRASLNRHADWFNAESKKVQDAAKKNPQDAKIPERLSGLLAQMKNRVFAVLSAAQLKRLRELSLQAAGPVALLDDQVAKRIGISASQLEKMRKAYTDNSRKAADLQEKTFRPIMAKYEKMKPKDEADRKRLAAAMEKEMRAAGQKVNPQVAALVNSTRTTIEGMMTAQQRQALTALLGKPWNPPRPAAPPKK